MKAIDFLDWTIKHDVCPEFVNRVRVEEDFDPVAYCGYAPDCPLVEGEYAVVYSDAIDDQAFADIAEHAVRVYMDEVDKRDGLAALCIMFIILT